MHLTTNSFISLLVLAIARIGVHGAATRAVTHEEIKEALINFMHIVRSNTEKLERHENREKQLGELLKRGLTALDKRGRAQDAILNKVLESQQSISEKLEKIERAMGEAEDAARGTYTVDTIPGQSIITQIETMINDRIDRSANNDRLKEVESSINSKVDYLSSVVEKLQASVYSVNTRLEGLSDKLGDGGSREALEKELQSQVHLNKNLMNSLDKQVESLKALQNEANRSDLSDIKNDLVTELNGVTAKLENKLAELTTTVTVHKKALVDTVNGSRVTIENQLTDLKNKFEDLNKEAKAIKNVEQVLVKTADDVMDTKRSVEHGIFQIRTEVNDYVKSSLGGNEYNDTALAKLTDIAETLLDNQVSALTNLSTKVEFEISQVWRQIGIMHQQVTASGVTLDNLQNQTNYFVKDTENKMDVASTKLEGIESSINLVQENNNFLVGRFSLFTHEFNETRNSLSQTTSDLKKVLKNAKLRASDSNPGPHGIDSPPVSGSVDNQLS